MGTKQYITNFVLKSRLASALLQLRRRSAGVMAPEPVDFSSKSYWEKRYKQGLTSGLGSYGELAEFKAEVLNAFVAAHDIRTVIEFGCGDGNQLSLAHYPSYRGFDVSATAIDKCRHRFKADRSKNFDVLQNFAGHTADLVLSLDVIYHLVEDSIFEEHVRTLFDASTRFVIIYSSDSESNPEDKPTHVRHRRFSDWVEKNIPAWRLIERLPNRFPFRGDYRVGTSAEFFIYEKK